MPIGGERSTEDNPGSDAQSVAQLAAQPAGLHRDSSVAPDSTVLPGPGVLPGTGVLPGSAGAPDLGVVQDLGVRPDLDVPQELAELRERLRVAQRGKVGFPGADDIDYRPLWELFDFELNNIGDPYDDPTFQHHTKGYEREAVEFFADLFGAPEQSPLGVRHLGEYRVPAVRAAARAPPLPRCGHLLLAGSALQGAPYPG